MRTKVPRYDLFKPVSEVTSRVKKQNKSKNTTAELMLRRHVWRLGLRYRVHVKDLPGKPDLVFPRAKVVVFCDGDFWHGRSWKKEREKLSRGKNADYWIPKIQANIERDSMQTKKLKHMGWRVVRLWETDVLRSPDSSALKVYNAVKQQFHVFQN